MINKKMVNELLSILGHKNISVVDTPNFHWNGNTVTDDKNAPSFSVSSVEFKNFLDFSNFLNLNKNSKIILFNSFNGSLMDEESNQIRLAII